MKALKNYISYLLFGILALSFLVALNMSLRRHVYESKQNTVSLALSYQETQTLAMQGGITHAELLSRLAQDVGITSIILEEDTLSDFIQSGKVTLLKGSEIMNMLRVGKVYRTILTHLKKKVKSDKIYLIIDETSLYERIKDTLYITLSPKSVVAHKWNILEITSNKEQLHAIGFGIDPKKTRTLFGYGFEVIPMLQNELFLNDSIIESKFDFLKSRYTASKILFKGDSALGYPNHLSNISARLKKGGLLLGYVEFKKQLGAKALTTQHPNNVFRVHKIPTGALLTTPPKQAVTRYLRAAKERSVHLLFLSPYTVITGKQRLLDANLNYFKAIHKNLIDFNFNIDTLDKAPLDNFIQAKTWELVLLNLGVLTLLLLTLSRFLQCRVETLWPIAVLYLAITFIGVSFDLLHILNPIAGLLSAILFPSFALLLWGPIYTPKKSFIYLFFMSHVYLAKLVGFCLLGILFIIGFLSTPLYVGGSHQFFGVKLSLLIPLTIIMIYYYLRPHRIKSIYYILKRLFHTPITVASLLAVLLCLSCITIYILRSGNYLTIPISEHVSREYLESLFFVRPRTKEFLIGYPFLLMGYLWAHQTKNQKWLWFFNTLGVIALISMVNSFCHIHTPIAISLYRSFLGVILGVIVAWTYMLIYTCCIKTAKLFSR